MTNMEFYRDEIEKLNKANTTIAVFNGKPVNCDHFPLCKGCEFFKPSVTNCGVARVEWLMAEHVEKPKLSKDERAFIKLLNPAHYITRNGDGQLYMHWELPIKSLANLLWVDAYTRCWCIDRNYLSNIKLDFIKWEDENPWKVSDLLELEVE